MFQVFAGSLSYLQSVPKIHKSNENPPGRPIINGIQSVGARKGQYIDKYLQPLAQKNKALLRDRMHLIQLLEEIQMEEGPCILATADVIFLYTITGHQDPITAIKWALKQLSDLPRKQRANLIEHLDYCSSHNYSL